MNGTLIALIISIIIVGALVFVAITLLQNRKHAFDKTAYQAAILEIDHGLKKDSRDSAGMTVMKADKLFDKALVEMGVPGKTMGDRLKKIGGRLSDEDGVWTAHKIRNRIAHETDYVPSYESAKSALSTYKQALKDIGAI